MCQGTVVKNPGKCVGYSPCLHLYRHKSTFLGLKQPVHSSTSESEVQGEV